MHPVAYFRVAYVHTILILLIFRFVEAVTRNQVPFSIAGGKVVPEGLDGIGVKMRTTSWQALGPFPMGTREWPLLDPEEALLPYGLSFATLPTSSKNNVSQAVEIPSALGTNGFVGWKDISEDKDGWVEVSYPEINWTSHRLTTGGWAGLQHYSLLRTEVDINPSGNPSPNTPITILANLIGAADFYFHPVSDSNESREERKFSEGELFVGDTYSYSLGGNPNQGSNTWGHVLSLRPGKYTLVVRFIYDVRAYGGAWTKENGMEPGIPKGNFKMEVETRLAGDNQQTNKLKVNVKQPPRLEVVPGSRLTPNVIRGWITGDGVGAGIRWWKELDTNESEDSLVIEGVKIDEPFDRYFSQAQLVPKTVSLSQNQIRPLSIRMTQLEPLPDSLLLSDSIPSSSSNMKHGFPCGVFRIPLNLTYRIHSPPDPKRPAGSTEFKNGIYTVRINFDFVSKHYSKDGEATGPFPFIVTHKPMSLPMSLAVVIPPNDDGLENLASQAPSLLYLHGAGISPVAEEISHSIPPQNNGVWVVIPFGRSEWGYDWHGASLREALSSVGKEDILSDGYVKGRESKVNGYGFDGLEKVKRIWREGRPSYQVPEVENMRESEKIIVIGHSNGGQGAWYLMSRFPDIVLGGVATSGYIKVQEYIPYHLHTSSRFNDPALNAVMTSSLTMFDNDLHLSNLVGVPLLIRHGAADNNVPVHHSRTYKSILSAWSRNTSSIPYSEVPNAPHWFPEVFRVPEVQSFLDDLAVTNPSSSADPLSCDGRTAKDLNECQFFVTITNPDESGFKNGFRISELDIPGRLARLDVRIFSPPSKENGIQKIQVTTKNVRTFILKAEHSKNSLHLTINGQKAIIVPSFSTSYSSRNLPITLTRKNRDSDSDSDAVWFAEVVQHPLDDPKSLPRRYGPMIQILDPSDGFIQFLFSSPSNNNNNNDNYNHDINTDIDTDIDTDTKVIDPNQAKRVAERLAHDYWVYGRGDSRISRDDLWDLETNSIGEMDHVGNLVLVTSEASTMARNLVKETGVSFISNNHFKIKNRIFDMSTHALLSLLPHPLAPRSLALLMAGNLKIAERFFPVRAGVLTPDWVVVGPTDWGSNGVIAAGFWNPEWKYSETMSYL